MSFVKNTSSKSAGHTEEPTELGEITSLNKELPHLTDLLRVEYNR
jgi:hypothetical protein